MKTIIIIPAYNVEFKINAVLSLLFKYKDDTLVVDDGSTDNTSKVVENIGFKLFRHNRNLGLAHTLNSGLRYAIEKNYESVITLDSDNQHDPGYIDVFLNKLSNYECVFGNRFSTFNNVPTCKIASNFFASLLVYSITGLKLRDVSCGYRGFQLSNGLSAISNSDSFSVIYEFLYNIIEKNVKFTIVDIPVVYSYDELLCTKVSEIDGLIKASLKYCKTQNLRSILNKILLKISKKEDFHFCIGGFDFFCFYISTVNSYIFQTDINKVDLFYK